MIGSLIRAVVLIVVVAAAGAFFLGWWGSGRLRDADGPRQPIGTTGVDPQKAREVGAKVGETTAVVAGQARRAINDGAVTAKIKAKMALDESVKALDIDVDTVGTTVTLSGVVGSEAQRARALQLARETEGVTQVVDQLRIRK